MTEDTKVRTTIAKSDMDDQGMVVVWDRGPHPVDSTYPPNSDEGKAERAQFDADVKAWKDEHGDQPSPIKMHANDAIHAVKADPERYALDAPDVDEAAVAAEVKKIRDARAAAEKTDADRAEAIKLAEDRKTAIATIMARRKAESGGDDRKAMARRDEIGAAAANREIARPKSTSTLPATSPKVPVE